MAAAPRDEPPDRRATWTSLLAQMITAMNALAPAIEALDLPRFDDLRRDLAFMQVTAELTAHDSKFAVVAGGNGRVWVLLRNGHRVLLDGMDGATLADWAAAWDDAEVRLQHAGLEPLDVLSMRNTIPRARNGDGFPATVHYFPPDSINWWLVGSSEHATIHGTINGGGDSSDRPCA